MGKVIKWVLGIAGALLALVVVAVIAVALLFDPEDYREDIERELSAAVGRDVTIGGQMSLSLFPWLAVETGDIAVASAPAFGPEPMLALRRVEAGVRVLPLLFGRIEVGTVSIDGLALRLATRGDGMTSWQDLLGDDTPDAGAEDVAARETGALRIAAVDVTDASVTYTDAMSGAEYAITDFELSLRNFSLDTPTPFDARFTVAAKPDDLGGEFRIAATVQPGDLEVVEIRGLDVAGTLRAAALAAPQALSLRAQRIVADRPNNSLNTEDLRFTFGPLEGTLALSGSGPASPLALSGQIALERFSPRELAAVVGVDTETTDPDALARASLTGGLDISYEAVVVNDIAARLDDTTLAGRFAYDLAGRPTMRFELAGDTIDIDRYLSPAEPGQAADAGDTVVETALPVDLIRGLSAAGSLRFERLTLGDLPFENLEVGVDVGGDKARLYPMSATVLEGRYRGDVRIDASGRTPALSLDERVEGLNLGTLARLIWERDNVAGTLNGRFTLGGRGETLSDVRRTLAGDVELLLSDGALTGTDIWHSIRAARARLRGETVPPAPSPPRTEFTSVQASATVRDGVARSDDLFAELPFLQLTGAGTLNLADATIDYGLRARVLERPEFLAGASAAELDEYTEAVIPLRLTGPIASPTVRPDIEGMVREAAKRKLDAEKERLRQRLLDELGGDDETTESLEDEAKKRLKKLFDR